MGAFWNTVKTVVSLSPAVAIAGIVAPGGSKASGALGWSNLTAAEVQQRQLDYYSQQAKIEQARVAAGLPPTKAKGAAAAYDELPTPRPNNNLLILSVIAFVAIAGLLIYRLRSR
jgi:hypothetical protein